MVEELQTGLHVIVAVELDECAAFTFLGVIFLCQAADALGLDGAEVLLYALLVGTEWKIA